ncbi:hypothetical protein [Agrobacterium larrymoorei]|nr:hypothetical protein [Agrobacterium larrymoorei]
MLQRDQEFVRSGRLAIRSARAKLSRAVLDATGAIIVAGDLARPASDWLA